MGYLSDQDAGVPQPVLYAGSYESQRWTPIGIVECSLSDSWTSIVLTHRISTSTSLTSEDMRYASIWNELMEKTVSVQLPISFDIGQKMLWLMLRESIACHLQLRRRWPI